MINLQNTIESNEKSWSVSSRCASMLPTALQPDVIMELATPHEKNVTNTPQSLNKPIAAADVATFTASTIDGFSSSANSDAAPTMLSAERETMHASRYNARGSTTGAMPTNIKAARQRELDELNRTNSNLFLRNLSPEVDQADLEAIFSEYGSILSSAVMRNIHTGDSLGTAFVRMSTHAEAQKAMEEINNRVIKSRAVYIQWAKRHDGAPVGDARKKIMKLFVRNIPLDCSVEALEALFSQYGGVRQVTLHKDTASVEDAAMERLIAFVIFTEEGAAERAATAVHNTKPFASCCGIPIMIKLAEDQVKHDRQRTQRNSLPVSSQQQQQRPPLPSQPSPQFCQEYADQAMDVAAFFEPIMRSPLSSSTGGEFNTGNSSRSRSGALSTNAGSVAMTPFDYASRGAAYIPPSALMPSAPVAMMSGQQCTSSSCIMPVRNDYMLSACPPLFMQVCSPPPVLCSPLTSPLALSGTTTGASGGSLAGSLVEGPLRTLPQAPSSTRSSPDHCVDGAARVGVNIPNPRSVIMAAASRKRVGDAVRIGGALKMSRPTLSPCLSVDSSTMLPLSPSIAAEELRSPLKYRHNPYSMSSSLFVC
ncbi:RNA binding protein [Lotmaria passim]